MSLIRHASDKPARPATRLAGLTMMALAAAMLTACGTSVKLDEGGNQPAPIVSANMPGSTSSSGVGSNGLSGSALPGGESAVAPVVAQQPGADASDTSLARVIFFDYDSNVIKNEFLATIDGHAKRLMASKNKRVLIEGHTDERGSREYNLALGQRRSEAVQKSLTLLGVSADQAEAVSFGEERPAAQGSGEEVWSQNRRAEIKDR
jgi:peptidoglycan-associated lipoprotein